jgi:hypothetical protein
MSTAANSQEKLAATAGEPGLGQEKAAAAKEDDRLPIFKEGWQFFIAPYLWVTGARISISNQGRFSGTVVADLKGLAGPFFVRN